MLILWAGYYDKPTYGSVTDFDGGKTEVEWTNHNDATAYSLCSIIFEDDIFIIGQVSKQ